jgi:diadenosine tetraphosphatase ApaH/serine/threonine PP2A family protein phosphatase
MTPAPRLYAVGDIHGRSDLLDRIILAITHDLEVYPASDCLTVTLGDYVDRGPDTRGVLDRLANNPFPTDFVALKGNHEELFEDFLFKPSVAAHWRHVGGLETLQSYGIRVHPLVGSYERAAKALHSALPRTHREFLRSLTLSLTVGKYFLCHAGVRPGILLEDQMAADLLWIREPFLESRVDFGKIIVHGHSPVEEPEVLPNRINIDTGAFMTGRLTCAVLEEEYIRFLSTK